MCALVASGMSYLESIKLVDRDLVARNIIVGDNNEVKVAGFRLTRIIEEEEYVSRQGEKLPIRWIEPESILFGKFSTESEVWSFGVLLYELITCEQLPYSGYYHFLGERFIIPTIIIPAGQNPNKLLSQQAQNPNKNP
jgi:serine/threonine protein kinase